MSNSSRRLQFGYFLLHKIEEMRFRSSELLQLCHGSRVRFAAGEKDASGSGRIINYHFSAFSSLVQTIKDVLPVVSSQSVSWADLAKIRHIEFMRSIRNAITHDGNPVINMWAEGRYYIAYGFVRVDQKNEPILVQVPVEDIETIIIQFTADLCRYLRGAVTPLLGTPDLQGPAYGSEFFDEAMNHPAVPKLARDLYAAADHFAPEREGGDPVARAIEELDCLASLCRSQ